MSDRTRTRDAATTDDDRPADSDRWLRDRPVTEARLPPDVAAAFGRFFGEESVETLGGLVDAVRAATGGGAIDVDDLCHADAETPHRATAGDEEFRFLCFYDAVALAHLTDDPVEIRTESPTGEPIATRASPAELTVDPADAALSFGVAADAVTDRDEGSTLADAYGAICPYVKAFPNREAYETWAASVDAATVGMPLAAGMPVAGALAE